MNKNTNKTVKLAKGEMNVYDFGGIKLHAYKTNDFIDDEVFIVEKNGKAVIIESPCFFDNNKEHAEYLKDLEVDGMFVAYHGAGASFMSDVPKYATQNAADYSANGGGKALIDNFTNAFGEIFDNSIHQITNIIQEGNIEWFDLSKKPIERASFTFGGKREEKNGYEITQKKCIGCKACQAVCPAKLH